MINYQKYTQDKGVSPLRATNNGAIKKGSDKAIFRFHYKRFLGAIFKHIYEQPCMNVSPFYSISMIIESTEI